MKKLIRVTTVPLSLDKLLDGQLSYMSNYFNVTAISSDSDYLKQCALKENTGYYHLEMSRRITPLNDLISLIKLTKYLLRTKPLIVHSHTPKAGIISMMASKIANVPLRLHTVAGLPLMEASGIKQKILIFVEKLTYKCATNVYSNSAGMYDFILENNFINKDKIKMLANGSTNGIDTSYFSNSNITEATKEELKDSLRITKNDFVFVFVGRLVGDKGINELVLAFKKLLVYNTNIKLLLVGFQEDQLDPLSESTLNEINSNRKILSVGYQNDIRPYLSISNCLVLPSYREGFPNVVMQAGAMDLPSIVTNINGCNEIIIDNINGLLVKSKNCYELEKAMYKIFNNPLLYDKLKSSSRGLITSRFEQKKVWKTILDEYRELENDLIYNNELKTITKKYFPVNLRQINFSNYLLSLLFLFFNSNK
jgi:glycosyltransferase involved in cell wall biosynthesis